MISLKLNLNKAIQHSETLHSEAMSDNIAERSQKVVIRASSSYFFLFFPIFLSILLFFLFFSNFLLFFLFFSHFTYNKQIFIRDLNILSLFKYVVYRVH